MKNVSIGVGLGLHNFLLEKLSLFYLLTLLQTEEYQ